MPERITVALDGPAGAGKSTVAKRVARGLGFTLVDTGAIYRAVAWQAQRRGIGLEDDVGLAGIVTGFEIRFDLCGDRNRVFCAGEEITDAIRTPEISRGASVVSAQKVVRDGLLAVQRELAGRGDAVLEGRDIGTVVFPEAAVKIYLDASPAERARRRFEELAAKGGEVPDLDQVLAEVTCRDARDMEREHAPLRPAEDALILDSTALTIDEVVARVIEAVNEARVDRAH